MKRFRLTIFFLMAVGFMHCGGYSTLVFAGKAATRDSWACIQGTEGSTKFIISAAILGFTIDLLLGYLAYRVLGSIGEKAKTFMAVLFAFYIVVTLVVSLQFVWVWENPMECRYDFEVNGLKIKRYGTYFELNHSSKNPMPAILSGCELLQGRPIDQSEYEMIRKTNYVSPGDRILVYDSKDSKAINTEMTEKLVSYCVIR